MESIELNKQSEPTVKETIEYIKKHQIVTDDRIEYYQKAYDVSKHDVFDRPKRPITEVVMNDKGEKEYNIAGYYEANKIGDSLANEIVDKAVSFTAGNKPNIEYITNNTTKEKALREILDDNKELALNDECYESLFAFSEVAEIWYYDGDEEQKDGKIRVHLVSPMYGDKLYPIIDRKRKMTGFAYSNVYKNEQGKDIEELVYYTKEATCIYVKDDSRDWELLEVKQNIYSKICVVYTNQEKADYEDVLPSIYRLETTTSNAGESTDRSAFPHQIIEGEVNGISHIPGQNSTYEIGLGAKVYYAESDQKTDLLELDLDRNEELVRKRTQTPDISLESLKGLGNISGEMLERLLIEPTLKARRKITKYLIKHHQRRMNVLNAMVTYFYGGTIDDVKFAIDIEPYVPQDINAKLDRLRKILGLMPMEYIVGQFKKEIDPSINVKDIMGMFDKEKVEPLGGSWE